MRAIKAAGGVVLDQHPDDCYRPQMPRAALRTGCVDFALALRALAPALVTLVTVPGALPFFGLAQGDVSPAS